jgi:hypothetical protein
MRRILICCSLSVLLYAIMFGCVLDRPLSLGIIRLEIFEKASRLASLPSPKIVILAGSNGPYSHACAVIGAMLNMPCENAGIAVGVGLDEIFIRDAPYLRPGDIVYMPMELPQYTANRASYRAGADAELMLRSDRVILAKLPADRIVGAVFCCNLSDLLEAMAEMPLAGTGAIRPQQVLAAEYNAEGDRIDNNLLQADPALLQHRPRPDPGPWNIAQGYGAELIGRFVRRESSQQVIVVGGLPTDFAQASLSDQTIRAISIIYTQNGGQFAMLPNHSLYPVSDFFNGEDHLARPCQYLHSIAIALLLGDILKRLVLPPSPSAVAIAATCPAAQIAYAMSAAR